MSLQAGDRVKVSTDYGSITVNWVPEKGLDSCYVFFPYGPWANQVYASSTSSTGMPIMKGISATIEPSEEKVLSLDEIVEKLKGGA
jgi:formylmethanofuran dehydrogenase subunit D